MNDRVSTGFLSALLLAASAGTAAAETGFDVGGLLFGDLYYVPSHHSEAGDGAAGAVLRRGYLTFDAGFGEHWFARLRFELNQSGEFEEYDFELDFKDIYLGRDIGRQQAMFGLIPTPTFDLIESSWGMRYLARTPMDLQGEASRDTGFSLKGPLNADGSLAYRAMVGGGVEFGAESDEGRKWMGALTWKPAPGWVFDIYAGAGQFDGPRDRTTLQAFASWRGDDWRWGAQYSHQDREQDPTLELASAFVVADLDERRSAFARVDRLLEPSPKGDDISYLPYDPSARATTLFTGLDFRLLDYLRLTPNVVYTRYDENDQGVRPRSDLHLRLTLFLDFE